MDVKYFKLLYIAFRIIGMTDVLMCVNVVIVKTRVFAIKHNRLEFSRIEQVCR